MSGACPDAMEELNFPRFEPRVENTGGIRVAADDVVEYQRCEVACRRRRIADPTPLDRRPEILRWRQFVVFGLVCAARVALASMPATHDPPVSDQDLDRLQDEIPEAIGGLR